MDEEEDEDFWVINRRFWVGREEVLFSNIFYEIFGRD